MCIFDPDQMLTPGGRVLGDETAQAGLELLVQSLYLPVGLGVITRRETARLFWAHTGHLAHILPDLLVHGGSPKALLEEEEGPLYSRVAGEAGGMYPVDDLRVEGRGDKQPILRTAVRNRRISKGLFYLFLDPPRDCSHHAGGGQDTGG